MVKLTIYLTVLAACVGINLALQCYECRGTTKDECSIDNSQLKSCGGSCVMVHAIFGSQKGYLRGCTSEKNKDKACDLYKDNTKKLYECSGCKADKCNGGDFST